MYVCMYVCVLCVCVCACQRTAYTCLLLFVTHICQTCLGNKSRSNFHHSVLTQPVWSMPVVRTDESLKLVGGLGIKGKAVKRKSTQQRPSPNTFWRRDSQASADSLYQILNSSDQHDLLILLTAWILTTHLSQSPGIRLCSARFDSRNKQPTCRNIAFQLKWTQQCCSKSRWENIIKNSLFLQDSFTTLAKQVAQGPESARATQWSGHGFDAFKGSTRSWLSDSCCHLSCADRIDHHDRFSSDQELGYIAGGQAHHATFRTETSFLSDLLQWNKRFFTLDRLYSALPVPKLRIHTESQWVDYFVDGPAAKSQIIKVGIGHIPSRNGLMDWWCSDLWTSTVFSSMV